MKYLVRKWYALAVVLACLGLTASCGMMTQDYEDCDYGLYVSFKYDYNLQRADMFNDHVGSVTLYVFDEAGRLVKTQEESNVGGVSPLADPNYRMHVTGLPEGSYQLIALAGQKPYADMLTTDCAKFVRTDMPLGSQKESLGIQLDRVQRGANLYDIVNNGLPLDTLWHGMLAEPVAVYAEASYRPTYATVSLVRDTKKINVTLREVKNTTTVMDINKYDMYITDHNSRILWDNSLDETDEVIYTPHATWNTEDRTRAADAGGTAKVNYIGHADFMTSRLIYHDKGEDDGVLVVTNKETGVEVARINVPDMLSRLRTSEYRYRYSEQEFLDRGYDYQINLFLVNDTWSYITVEISVLGWTKRIQFEDL